MKKVAIVLILCSSGCISQLFETPKPRVVLAWQEKVSHCAVFIKDMDLPVSIEREGPLPYSANSSAAVWIGKNFPPDQVGEVVDIGRTYYKELRYVAMSDYGIEDPPRQVHYDVVLGGSTETAMKLGLKAWNDQDFKKLKTVRTREELEALVRSKYGEKRPMP
ncbi:MAG: hypothetical protein JNM27_01710 [Leptospirales bacterium]|nr:hypothetical protein [Leptospirales bacterium]